MAKQVRNSEGKIVRLEIQAKELSRILDVEPERLARWSEVIKPSRGSGDTAVFWIKNRDQLELHKKRALLLKTGMTPTAVKNVEKEGLLDGYAGLCEDCPEGITAHVWRSYGMIVLMQVRYGKMIGVEELAKRANINKVVNGKVVPDVEMAAKHIRLLSGIGYLSHGDKDWEGQWKHKGLPSAWVKEAE